MKKALTVAFAFVLILGAMQTVSFADKGSKKSVADKFFKKVHIIYMYQDELGVTDEQLDQIKELKIALKKDKIRKKADIKILKVDIKSALYEDEIDLPAVNKLIDQKYDLKKAKAKMAVQSLARLKKILTEEQKEKLKGLYLEKKKQKMMKGSH